MWFPRSLTWYSRVLQGRNGADGARGMPGEAGSKVKNTPGYPVNQWEALGCIWKVVPPKWSIELTICYCAVSGWQRFWRSPWSSWRKGAQSKYEERFNDVCFTTLPMLQRLLHVSRNTILQSFIFRPKSSLFTVTAVLYSVVTPASQLIGSSKATSHPSHVHSSVDRFEFWTSGTH